MGTKISENIATIKEIKEDIKTAITDKGQTIDDDTPFTEYANKIKNITTGAVSEDDLNAYIALSTRMIPADLYVPAGITKIGNYLFQGSNGSTNTMPAIEKSSMGSSYITSFTAPAVEEIDNYGFYGNTKVKTINLPALKRIGNYALGTSTMATSSSSAPVTVILGALESVGASGLAGRMLNTGEDVNYKFTFNNCVLSTYAFKYNALKDLDLTGVSSIGKGAFQGSAHLRKVWIPSTINTITATTSSSSNLFSSLYNCTIYTDVADEESIPENWSDGWNYSDGSAVPTVYGATHEDYLNAETE